MTLHHIFFYIFNVYIPRTSLIIHLRYMYYIEMILSRCYKPCRVKVLPFIIRLTRGNRLISAINWDNWRVRPRRPSGAKSSVPTVWLRMRIPRTFPLAVLCVYLRDIYAATLSQSTGWFARDKRYLVYPPPRDYTPTKVQVYTSSQIPKLFWNKTNGAVRKIAVWTDISAGLLGDIAKKKRLMGFKNFLPFYF